MACMHACMQEARNTQLPALTTVRAASVLTCCMLEIQFKQLRKQGELAPIVVQVISVVATTAASLCQWPLGSSVDEQRLLQSLRQDEM
jgi:hypothetical protein